uniref:PDZ domain-containing protein n=1 Tax=Echeneis naucrates TaxID=173247 RepID=A0A665WGZ4_ECHNA
PDLRSPVEVPWRFAPKWEDLPEHHEGLGFSIRGGSEHGVGIYVSLVEPGSSAEREGLRIGDQIVTVNDLVFVIICHDEAVHILKTGHHLLMKVRDVGHERMQTQLLWWILLILHLFSTEI